MRQFKKIHAAWKEIKNRLKENSLLQLPEIERNLTAEFSKLKPKHSRVKIIVFVKFSQPEIQNKGRGSHCVTMVCSRLVPLGQGSLCADLSRDSLKEMVGWASQGSKVEVMRK